jgi:hypothetical protein
MHDLLSRVLTAEARYTQSAVVTKLAYSPNYVSRRLVAVEAQMAWKGLLDALDLWIYGREHVRSLNHMQRCTVREIKEKNNNDRMLWIG